MPVIYDSPSERPGYKPRKKRKRYVPPVNPDAQDRARSKSQKAHDLRIVNRNIAQAKTRLRVTPDQADRNRSAAQKAHDAQIVAQNIKLAREMYLRKRGAGSAKKAITKFLGGGLEFQKANAVSTGLGPTRVTVRKGGGGLQFAVTKPLIPRSVPIDKKSFGGRFALDLANLGPGALVGGAQTAAAAYDLAHLRPKKTVKLAKEFNASDAPFNAAVAAAELATGDTKSAKKRIKTAGKTFNEHPAATIIEVAGLKGLAGRGAGAGVRLTGKALTSKAAPKPVRKVGKKVKRVGTTKRAPKTLPGTRLVEHRRYSKDLSTKAIQVLAERRATKRSERYSEQAKKAETEGERQTLQTKARDANPRLIRDTDIQKRVDEQHSMAEDVRRISQAEVIHREAKELKGAKKGGPVTSLLAQRIVRPKLKALKQYRDDVKAAQKNLSGARKSNNIEFVQQLDKAIEAIEKGKVSLDDLKSISDRYIERSTEAQYELTRKKRQIYDAEQSERRSVLPFAIREQEVHKDLPLLKEREAAASKTARRTGRTAKRARGRALVAQRTHKATQKAAQERVQAHTRPAVPPWALKVLQGEAERQTAASAKKAKTATKRADTKTAKAQAARETKKAASRERKANPFLIEDGEKRVVTTSEMLEALEKAYGKKAAAALVSQRPPQRKGGGDFYRSGLEPVGGETRSYEGTALKEGTYDASIDQLTRAMVSARTLRDAFDNYKAFIDEFALLDKAGKRPYTEKNRDIAQQRVDDLNAHGGTQWSLVRLSPYRGNKGQLTSMMEEGNPRAARSETEQIKSALSGEGETGPWAIIPKAAARRMQGHLDALSPNTFDRGARSLSTGFRRGVLATSIPWMKGNAAEAGFRSAINRVGPATYMRGRRYVKALEALDPEQAKRTRARTIGGGRSAYAERQTHANLDAYDEGLVKNFTAGWRKIRSAPVAKQAAWLWDHWTHYAFALNKSMEQVFQTGMLGKAVGEFMPDGARKTSKAAVEQFAKQGHLDANLQTALAREVDKMYGRYSKFSPAMRTAVDRYTPFLAWMQNAAWMIGTLPERHPTTTTAIGGSVAATEDERKKLHLDAGTEGVVPKWLRGAMPDKHGGHYQVLRFTPLGLLADPLGTASAQILPQIMSTLDALEGREWTGGKLKGSDGEEANSAERLLAAGVSATEPLVPFASLVGRGVQKGPKELAKSAILGYVPPGTKKSSGGGKAPSIGGSRFKSGNRFKSNRFKSSSRFSSRFK